MAKRTKDARAFLTPNLQGDAVELSEGGGLRFRKMILPVGRGIDYVMKDGKTRRLDFTSDYVRGLAESFTAKAYPDGVPFMLAGPDNAHTMDPERQRGNVVGLSAAGDGLYADIEFTTPEAAELVRRNPNLGVSAQIIENLRKPTGQTFKRAIRHVLGTLGPRVEGMKPWEPVGSPSVSLSDEVDADRIIDLSQQSFTEESLMGKRKGTTSTVDTLDLSDDVDTWTDDEVDAFLDEFAGEGDDDTNLSDTTTTTVDLTDDVQRQVDLAIAPERARLAQLEADTAAERWDTASAAYVGDGVPPWAVDLCAPVLSLPEHVVEDSIDLSVTDDKGRTAPLDVRGLLTGILDGLKGTVDLSDPVGHGGHGGSEATSENDEFDKQWAAQRGDGDRIVTA